MVEITLFTDTVKCTTCNEIDMYHGLKKKNDRWYCKKCFHQQHHAAHAQELAKL